MVVFFKESRDQDCPDRDHTLVFCLHAPKLTRASVRSASENERAAPGEHVTPDDDTTRRDGRGQNPFYCMRDSESRTVAEEGVIGWVT